MTVEVTGRPTLREETGEANLLVPKKGRRDRSSVLLHPGQV
jgi:hypothetical protein